MPRFFKKAKSMSNLPTISEDSPITIPSPIALCCDHLERVINDMQKEIDYLPHAHHKKSTFSQHFFQLIDNITTEYLNNKHIS
jgi:hypothetical protein